MQKLPPSLAERVHRQNLKRYRYELWTATSPDRRAMLLSLIAGEDARANAEGWVPDHD
jgi:hypothetical protein